jgi:hypothetical protein
MNEWIVNVATYCIKKNKCKKRGIQPPNLLKIPDPGSGLNIPNLIFENQVYQFFGLKILEILKMPIRIRDPVPCQPWIRDGKKSDTG